MILRVNGIFTYGNVCPLFPTNCISTSKVTFLVPKFHLPAHIEKCQTGFSFNLTRGVRRTDGEAPERGWSDINPLSLQTKQMGPASHRETIDDHFGDWNHKKVVGLGNMAQLWSPGLFTEGVIIY